jgi:hypothetical protein
MWGIRTVAGNRLLTRAARLRERAARARERADGCAVKRILYVG